MRSLWKKAAAVGFLLFVGLWTAGIIRSATLAYPEPPGWYLPISEEPSARQQVANNLRQIGLALAPLPLVLDQPEAEKIRVHEKTAQLAAATSTFDADVAQLRAALAAQQATVFNEKHGGVEPDRRITLEIGVHPDRFDSLVEQLRQVARLRSVNVQQRDRTGEFRRLNAQRQSLKKYLESVLKLRGAKSASIDDQLKLEQRIQDIEKEMQALSVQFGEFLGKESFYNIHVSLFEYQPGSRLDPTYTVPQRVAHGFVWALGWWLASAAAVVLVVGASLSVWVLWPRRQAGGASPTAQPAA
jgi:hypothetical protein